MDSVARQNPVISINSNCGNVTDSYRNVWNNCHILVADEKWAVLEWLSPLQPRERHQAIGIGRVAGVGDWLLHTNEFAQWHESGDGTVDPVLFCYGNPGAGKTYLSSLVIDRLCDQVDADNIAVACMYCDFHAQDEQSATELLGALLKQVVSALEPIPDDVRGAFLSSKGRVGGRRLLLPDILGMLVRSLSRLRRVFICIDALDEFPAKHRPELWESLQQIVQKCPNTRLFLTGRLHIRDEVQKYFPRMAKVLPISPSEHDIGLYLRMRLNRDSELDAMDGELEADILRIIPKAISGIFLLVSLNMDAILAEVTLHQRRQTLHRMTNGLGLQDAYKTALDRIRQQSGSKARLGMEALMWISNCERPLKPDELCHALGVELGTEDFTMHNVPSIRTVLGCTLGLATIDEKASEVRLLHFTLQEYLRGSPSLFVTAHSMMAEICLTYLNYRSVRALPLSVDEALEAAPFLKYAASFWGTHATREVTKPVKALALRVLDGYENYVSAAIFLQDKRPFIFDTGCLGVSGLHCIAFWGIEEIAIAMLEMKKWDVNGHGYLGETPLISAVRYSNSRMAELLLEQENIEPDAVNEIGRTAFSCAAYWGSEGFVKLLLERGDVNPDSSDNDGRTPLSLAAEEGEESVVKLLLGHPDVSPNSQDSTHLTPLSYAALAGQEGVVKLLLERVGVDIDSPDSTCPTPLSIAALAGKEGVVKLLLERADVDPDSPDSTGKTPISLAAWKGHGSIVKLLLGRRDVNPNSRDSDGRTPLSYAADAKCEQEGIVELLLERGDVNPDSSDSNGRTPLSFAASRGYEGVVKLLLERGDVNPNSSDEGGRTSLSFSAQEGAQSVVKLLLRRGDVNPNLADNKGRIPLSYAAFAEVEKVGIVKILLERDDVNPALPDIEGQTPLLFAARRGNERIAKLLLERDDVDPNSSDSKGSTPLSLAALRGHQGVVKLLLERGDINPNSPNNEGRTPLSLAAEWEREGTVQLLLERADLNPDLPDNNGRTPLSHAVEWGRAHLVKQFLEHGDVNPDSPDNGGRTPLSYAADAEWGQEDIGKLLLELLIERGGVYPGSSDSDCATDANAVWGLEDILELVQECMDINSASYDTEDETPLLPALLCAALRGPESVVKLFLELDDVNPNSSDNNGRTPLSYAAERGREQIVKQFLERGDVNRDPPDCDGRTPMSYATMMGHEGTAKLFLEPTGVNPNPSHRDG